MRRVLTLYAFTCVQFFFWPFFFIFFWPVLDSCFILPTREARRCSGGYAKSLQSRGGCYKDRPSHIYYTMVHNLRFERQQDGQRLHSLLLTCIALDIDIISYDPAAFKQPTNSKAASLNKLNSSYPRAPEFHCQPPKRQYSNLPILQTPILEAPNSIACFLTSQNAL